MTNKSFNIPPNLRYLSQASPPPPQQLPSTWNSHRYVTVRCYSLLILFTHRWEFSWAGNLQLVFGVRPRFPPTMGVIIRPRNQYLRWDNQSNAIEPVKVPEPPPSFPYWGQTDLFTLFLSANNHQHLIIRPHSPPCQGKFNTITVTSYQFVTS